MLNLNTFLKIIFTYFTFWSIILQILYYSNFVKIYQESILYIALIVSLVGFIITYIYPKRLNIKYNIIGEIKGKTLQIYDLVFHQLPLLLLLYNYDHTIPPDNFNFLLITIIVYLILLNPFKIYNV